MSRWSRYLPLVVLALLVCLFFYKLAFTNLILARGDTFTYFYPYWDVRSEYFRHLQLPLWTGDIFMGSPLLAEPQLGTFYPPNWLVTPFSAPNAVRYSILGHIFWASLGVYILFNAFLHKRGLNISAVIAAILFAFGGFIGAHVEQINQLQGLAWMPWIFWLFFRTAQPLVLIGLHPLRSRIGWGLALAVAFAMQFFSGHTQTVFITGIGLGVFLLCLPWVYGRQVRGVVRHIGLSLSVLITVAVVTLWLVMPQFLPTLELTGMSNRGGSGFTAPQSTAFSLPLHYIGRTLLPSYDGLLFGEYISTMGVIGLCLALLAVLYPRTDSPMAKWRWVWLVLAVVGLLFAFGRYNPLYYNYLAEMRGFNLFRVPARWLAIFSLATAMLGGIGMHFLLDHRQFRKRALIPIALVLGLIFVARFLPTIVPALAILPDDIVGSAIPTPITLFFWGVALVGFALMAFVRIPRAVMVLLVVVEMWGASQIMSYNDLTPHDVYDGKRFTVSQMQAYAQQTNLMGRVLSISQLLFDVGDKARLREHYEALGMGEDAIQIAFTALKRQEMMASNLPMKWGIASVDGYGGGILPTMYYTQFTSLIMPEGMMRTVDGRLSEALARPECRGVCVPSDTTLRMMNVQYLIADKIYDVWHNDVSYDTTFDWNGKTANANQFNADALGVIYLPTDSDRGLDTATLTTPTTTLTLVPKDAPIALADGLMLQVFTWDEALPIEQVQVTPQGQATRILALSLIHRANETFVKLTPQEWTTVLSSDIKMYRRTEPRAFIAHDVAVYADNWQGTETSLSEFNASFPTDRVVLYGDVEPLSTPTTATDQVTFVDYSPTRIVLTVQSEQEGYLVLSDAWYPHWKAQVNDIDTVVIRANIMFRAVKIPSGVSEIVFTFEPTLWWLALGIGGVGWALLIGIAIWLWRTYPHSAL